MGGADATAAVPGSAQVLTFLLTDLAGSSDLYRRHPDEMFHVMTHHDELVVGAIRRHGGDPFKHTGDGVVAVFGAPVGVVRAAIEIQKGVPTIPRAFDEELLLRIGICTGAARPWGNDYFGPALNTAARLEGAASGHQILLTESTRLAMVAEVEDDLVFEDLGMHRFKGLDPITVVQVSAPGLPDAFPPIGGKRDVPGGNLPANLTSFIGRHRDVDGVRGRLGDARIVSLHGPGGIGKTRLAIEVARSLQDDHDDGAWLVELSPLDPGDELWPSFAGALQIPPFPDASPRVQVLDRLRDADAILLVDNCEHVLDDAAAVVTEIATSAPRVRFLCTTRRLLGVPGEATVQVEPLDEVLDGAPHGSPAVQLFVERALLADPTFAPGPVDLEVIAAICADLDHLPLAIEIAAANLRRLDLAQVQQRAGDPLTLGTNRRQRVVGRQQTIRETLAWSYELLDATSAATLDALCAFSGPFVEDVGRDICSRIGLDAACFDDAFDELLDSSLLTRDPGGDERFRILRLVRAFGRDRLVSSAQLSAVERAHGETFAARARHLAERFDSPDEARASRMILGELPDMRAAVLRSLEHDPSVAARLVAPLFYFNYVHRGAEHGEWPARIMAHPESDAFRDAPIILAAAAAHALHADGDIEAARAFLERGRRAEAGGASSSQGWLESVAGQLDFWTGDRASCIERHRRAADEAATTGNNTCEVVSLCLASFAASRMHDRVGADELLRAAAVAGEGVDGLSTIGLLSFSAGAIEAHRDPAGALKDLEAAVAWGSQAGNEQGANRVRRVIADITSARAEPADALRIRARALLDFPERGDTIHSWSTVASMTKPLAELGRYDEVAVLAGAVAGSPISFEDALLPLIDQARAGLGAEVFDDRARFGAGLSLPQVRRRVAEDYFAMADGRG